MMNGCRELATQHPASGEVRACSIDATVLCCSERSSESFLKVGDPSRDKKQKQNGDCEADANRRG